MSKPRISATARVTFTVEIAARSTWGADCGVDQIHRQAGQETKLALTNALAKSGLRGRIISTKTVAVMAEESDA